MGDILMAVAMVCPSCGDRENVVRDAFASWNEETQEWELLSVYDSFSCNSCGAEFRAPKEEELPE